MQNNAQTKPKKVTVSLDMLTVLVRLSQAHWRVRKQKLGGNRTSLRYEVMRIVMPSPAPKLQTWQACEDRGWVEQEIGTEGPTDLWKVSAAGDAAREQAITEHVGLAKFAKFLLEDSGR
jgi:hypothetical protein